MLLKKCAHCRKDIPPTMTECPYCHRDQTGQDAAAELTVDTSFDAQVQRDLDLLGSDDPFTRQTAADRIGQRGISVIPHLINLLQDHTHRGIYEAARLLGRLRDRRAVGALVEALNIGDEDLRTSAVWALSQLNDPRVLEELLREAGRNNPMVQGYLAHVLAGYQDPRVVPALIKLAQNKNREVSFHAIWTLGEAGDAAAIAPLRRLLGRRDALIRSAAEAALRRLGGPVRRTVPVWGVTARWVAGLSAAAVLIWHFYK